VDNDYSADFDDIIASVRDSDVVVLTFVRIAERLLLDFRSSPHNGPLVRVVPRARSVAERLRVLRSWRPGFADPEIVVIGWPGFARSLARSGVLDEIAARITASGHPDSLSDVHRAYRMLVMLDDGAARKAVCGHGFRTIWSASPTPR
jgi:hypothetical protein